MSAAANFKVDDVDCLVCASLACPVCLSGAVDWSLVAEDYDSRADCRCGECGGRHAVYVTPEQAVRLSLHERRPLDPTPRPELSDIGVL